MIAFVCERLGLNPLHGGGAVFIADRSIGQVVATTNHLVASDINQRDFFALTGLKADGCPGRNIKSFAVGLFPVEFECRVGLNKMIVAADLNGSVSQVGDRQNDRFPSGVQF